MDKPIQELKIEDQMRNLLLDAIQIDDFEKLEQVLSLDSKLTEDLLLMAMNSKKANVVSWLLSKLLSKEDKKIQVCLIHKAIELNDLSVMQKLIELGYLSQSTCNHELPPLFELVRLGRLKWLQLFHRAGVSFEEKLKSGMPLLHFALSQKSSSEKLIRLLLYWGANLDEKDSFDLTPLHYLALEGGKRLKRDVTRIAQVLLKYGSDPNTRSKFYDQSILHTAVKSKNFHLVELLIMYGADINVKNEKNLTVLNDCPFNVVQIHIKYSAHRICWLLMGEVKRLESINEFVDPEIISLKKDFRAFCTWHESSMQKMRSCKIIDGVYLRDILISNENKLTKLMKIPKMYDLMESLQKSKLIISKRILRFRLKKGLERGILYKKCEQPFKDILKWEAPIIVIENIFSYLSRTDLRSFYAAFHPAAFLKILMPKKVTKESLKYESESSEDDEQRYLDDSVKSDSDENYVSESSDEYESDGYYYKNDDRDRNSDSS